MGIGKGTVCVGHGPGNLQQALQLTGSVGLLGLVPASQKLTSHEHSRY